MSVLTIIIPAFNEEKGIKNTIEDLLPFAKKNNWEILVVNDGSSDRTKEIISEISGISYINHPYNKGYGASLKTGIKASEGNLIAFYDADGQHDPKDLENLAENIDSHDMVVGQRGKDSHQDLIRKPGKWVLGKVANFLVGRKIPDLNSGLRVIRKDVIINLLHLFPDGFSFSTTSTVAFMNMGYDVVYIKIKVKKRVGTSSVRQIRHGANTILLITRLIVLFNPLKVFMPIALLIFWLGCFYEIIAGIILAPSIDVLPAAILMILAGIIIFFFGLVVDQISELRKHFYLNMKE
jgi:glycosyltransferase involved in cell wall biosynthesis